MNISNRITANNNSATDRTIAHNTAPSAAVITSIITLNLPHSELPTSAANSGWFTTDFGRSALMEELTGWAIIATALVFEVMLVDILWL